MGTHTHDQRAIAASARFQVVIGLETVKRG
jgi:hypothetical protein